MQPDPITGFALLPGFPRPQSEGPHFEALMRSVEAHGQTRPVLIDEHGLVWDGRTLTNVLLTLGRVPQVQVVADGYGAAVASLAQRDLTVVETADLVARVYQDQSANIALRGGKRSEAVSCWFKHTLGKTRGYSTRQVEQYLRVARASLAERCRMGEAHTLAQAIRILDTEPPEPEILDQREPTNQELQVVDMLVKAIEAVVELNDVTAATKELIRRLLKGCLRFNR